jgi:hypothetical protein
MFDGLRRPARRQPHVVLLGTFVHFSVLGAALAMIGPGCCSVDARVVGRKHIEILQRQSRDRVRVAHPERGVLRPSDLGTTRRPHRGLLTNRLPFRLPAKGRSK